MKKKIVIGLILIGIIILVVFCIVKNTLSSTNLELTYDTNGGVPYKWEYEISDKDIVEFVKTYEVENKNKNGMVGAPIKTNYVFKGLKEGKTTIIFKYVSIVNNEVAKEEKYTVEVNKNRKIVIVKKEKIS